MTHEPAAEHAQDPWQRRLFVLALLALVVVASYNDLAKVFWLDEAYSLDTATRSLGGTYERALHFEMQPPVYFVLLHLWLKASASVPLGRALSTVSVALAVGALYRTGRELGISSRWASLGLFAALCPQLVWASSEMRVYGLAILLCAGSLHYFVRCWVTETGKARDHVLFVVLSVLALLTQYYAGFVLAGQFVAGLVFSRRRRSLVLGFAAIGLAMLPWVPVVLEQAHNHPLLTGDDAPSFSRGSVVASAAAVARWTFATVLRALLSGPLVTRGWSLAIVVAATAASVVLRFRGGAPASREEKMLGLAVAVPAVALLAIAAFDVAYVMQRHWAVTVPATLAVIGLAVTRAPSETRRRAIGALILSTFALGILSVQRNLLVTDWRSGARVVAAQAQPGEPVTAFPSRRITPFRYYYAPPEGLHGLPRDALDDSTISLPITSERELDQAISALLRPGGDSAARTFWLVRETREEGLGAAHLDAFLETRVDVVAKHEFRGLTVYRVTMR